MLLKNLVMQVLMLNKAGEKGKFSPDVKRLKR